VSRGTIIRVKIALVMLIAMALFLPIAAQHHWDQQCAASQPGSHWNGDDWMCESSRR
jgi:hypothetical protein